MTALLALSLEAPGANCVNGGTRVDAGADTNANGVLEATEITSTNYVCNGVSAPWINVTAAAVQAVSNASYVSNYSGLGTMALTLPASPAVGDTVGVIGAAGDWKFVQNAGQSILVGDASNVKATATTYTAASAGNAIWNPVAADATGINVFAGKISGPIVVSHDGGTTWSTSLATNANWRGIAVSSDGQKVFAVAYNSLVYKSIDGGANWTSVTVPGQTFERIATSSNGQIVLAASDANGGVYLSTDGGATFAVAATASGGHWVSASMSSDGKHLIATQNATVGFPITSESNDGGATWNSLTVPSGIHQTAFSGDGKTLVGLTYQGTDNSVYLSKDYGVTWAKSLAIPGGGGNLLRVSISANGQTIVAGLYNGPAYVSYDGGLNWGSNASGSSTRWYGAAVSGDGSTVFIADTNNGLIEIGKQAIAPLVSTVGVAGFLDGAKYSGATVQYIGNNTWLMLNTIGPTYIVGPAKPLHAA